jgi:hypothetical protein
LGRCHLLAPQERRPVKWPPLEGYTGHDGAYPSEADCHAWAQAHPDGNLALRLPPDVIGIDVDDHSGKNGGANRP